MFQVETIEDTVQLSLIKILNNEDKGIPDAKIKELKKRKLVTTQ